MENKQLTSEQKDAAFKLVRNHMKVNFFIFLKYLFFIYLASALTVGIDVFYVKSDSFVFPIMLVNLIFLMHFMLKESESQRTKYNVEMKKILYPDQEVK